MHVRLPDEAAKKKKIFSLERLAIPQIPNLNTLYCYSLATIAARACRRGEPAYAVVLTYTGSHSRRARLRVHGTVYPNSWQRLNGIPKQGKIEAEKADLDFAHPTTPTWPKWQRKLNVPEELGPHSHLDC